ncbi:peptidylprolyl isomerase [Vibrio hannami]|uniref:peptidylprolyl isomerase n=1 Tax=Vibrio hannami TaxID=2717094 RepID=UPI002410A9C2|nr:peptidylprolyl isomerase [Vibrio hannami]MDG3085020.1 peptidylprolyl isomerase [Vibrio hannami]
MDKQKKRYLRIKLSTEKHKLNPEYLSAEQLKELDEEVNKLQALQAKIISSKEASKIKVSSGEVVESYCKCIEQFDSKDEFYAVLKKQGITQEGFKHALREELWCDKVLDSVAQDVPKLDKQQAIDYYNKNKLNFSRAKTWKLSQILITVNDEFVENRHESVLRRIEEAYQKTKREPFEELALRYSECPSALEKGQLGWCEEGKLFPEITKALQTLQQGEVSLPIETEVGFHLVQWHEQKPAYIAPFEEVLPYLEEKHTSRAKAFLQRQWLSSLVA